MHNLRKAKGHHIYWFGSVVKELIIYLTAKKKEWGFFHLNIYPIYSRFGECAVLYISWFKKTHTKTQKNLLQSTS